jgi:PncC family amidohydrolase
VELLVRSDDPALLETVLSDMKPVLGSDLVSVGQGNLEDAVLRGLEARGQTLAVAESMTGGLLSARLTAIPGASRSFLGGATVYSLAAKAALLGLPAAFLAEHGTVSEATTIALAEAARTVLGATWGLAVTGNAGPGAEGEAPVGTVFLAVAGPGGTVSICRLIPGDRSDVQMRSAAAALDFLRRQMDRP